MENKIFDWKEFFAFFGTGLGIFGITESISGDFFLSIHLFLGFVSIPSLALMGNRWLMHKKERFKIEAISNGKEGEEVKNKIESAKSTIHTTHTYPYVPTKSYTNTLIYRIKENVKVFRIIDPVILEDQNVFKWLSEFSEFRNNKGYFEYHLKGSSRARIINFTIIDKEIVFIYLSDSMTEGNQDHAIEIKSKRIAESFLSVFDKLIKASEKVPSQTN